MTENHITTKSKAEVMWPVSFDGFRLPSMPPLVKDAEARMEAIRDFQTRPDDIILSAFPRSGTHWTWEIIGMLCSGKAEYSTVGKETRFFEMVGDLKSLDEIPSPRILNTHVPYRWMPTKVTQGCGKIVHVVRNPKDTLASIFNFQQTVYGDRAETDWNTWFREAVCSKELFYDGWFKSEKDFEAASKATNNIYTLYYENLKTDAFKEIKKLSQFLELDTADELVQEICKKCNFTEMKRGDAVSKKQNMHMRKGEIGDWKNYFTVAQNELFDAMYEKEMKNSNLKITFVV